MGATGAQPSRALLISAAVDDEGGLRRALFFQVAELLGRAQAKIAQGDEGHSKILAKNSPAPQNRAASGHSMKTSLSEDRTHA